MISITNPSYGVELLEHPLIAPRAERFRLMHTGSVDDASAVGQNPNPSISY